MFLIFLKEARAAIKASVDKRLTNFDCEDPKEGDVSQLSKDLADDSKKAVRSLNRDGRYKYLIQVISGQNKGQGVRMGSRQFWDKDTDNLASVTVIKKDMFLTVVCFAVYLY
mgnify:FL=1